MIPGIAVDAIAIAMVPTSFQCHVIYITTNFFNENQNKDHSFSDKLAIINELESYIYYKSRLLLLPAHSG